MSNELAFTGERFTPECVREIFYEHMHRYVMAAHWVQGLDVLDAACGEGYGSAILASQAASVTGLDLSEEAVQHASQRYASQQNLQFRQGDCCQLPFDDHSFDAVVSFETLEHLQEQEQMLAEFRRVLKPQGFLVISTPDKAVYSDQQGHDNPYHVRELYLEEFQALLDAQFPARQMLGQRLMFQSVIWPVQTTTEGRVRFEQLDAQGQCDSSPALTLPPVYFLALCGASERCLPDTFGNTSLFHDQEESVYAHYHHEIRKNMAAGQLLADMEQKVRLLEQAAAAAPPQPESWLARMLRRLRGGP